MLSMEYVQQAPIANCFLLHTLARHELQEVKVWEPLRPTIANGKFAVDEQPVAADIMSNAMLFWIGDRVEKDTSGECLGDPPSQR